MAHSSVLQFQGGNKAAPSDGALDPRCPQLALEEPAQQVDLNDAGCDERGRLEKCLVDGPPAHILVHCTTAGNTWLND